MNRRTLLTGLAVAGIYGIHSLRSGETAGVAIAAAGAVEKIEKTEAEWRAILSPDQFRVLRKAATERAGSSPLDREKRKGMFHCAGCDLAVYPSETKFDSGTGWPSFYAPVAETHIGTSTDYKLIFPRTEVHCARCEGHLGHIFDDGPPPTGKRHCLNGLALKFKPAAA